MIVGCEAAVGEQEPKATLAAQRFDHRDDGVAHVIGDRAAAEGQAAEHRRGTVPRPAENAPRHLRHAGKAAVKLDMAEILDRSDEHTSELQSLMRISTAVF